MTDNPLRPQDAELLARVHAGNDWLRSVLCTLARHGTRLRQQEPARAAELIKVLSPWPWFKAGQFLFDLLEWEDFMVDGPPPPALPTVLQPENWQRLHELLGTLRGLIDSSSLATGPGAAADGFLSPPSLTVMVARFNSENELPPLEPGLHLYRDVVLGAWSTAVLAPSPEEG